MEEGSERETRVKAGRTSRLLDSSACLCSPRERTNTTIALHRRPPALPDEITVKRLFFPEREPLLRLDPPSLQRQAHCSRAVDTLLSSFR